MLTHTREEGNSSTQQSVEKEILISNFKET